MIANTNIYSIKKNKIDDCIFSILIPSWNNLPYLKLCVESIRKNSIHKHQIIIHVNEGTDGTLDWIESQTDINYTYSSENIGVCYALNYSRTLATTNYIVYINDDMYLCPGWDDVFLQEIKIIGHPYFFLSATCIEPVASSICAIGNDYGRTTESFNEQLLLKEFASLPKKDWSGATWPPNIVHKDVWDIVGGYSIEFSPGMYSDPDFSMKLWKAGVRLFKGLSASRAYHFGSKSVKRIVKNEGYYKFIFKWGITSSTLTNYFLKRGNLFTESMPEPKMTFLLLIKNIFKRIVILHRFIFQKLR